MSRQTERSLAFDEEGRLLGRLRRRLMANLVRQTLAQSQLRISLVVGLSALFWLGIFFLFVEAFQFLALSIPHAQTRDQAVRAMFGVFFTSLLVMLIFSAGIILYSSLFRSYEARFLLTTPLRCERVFLYKFQESILFSSWGFLLLGSPMLVAYGLVAGAPWYYFAMLLPFMLAFVCIPCGVGAIGCLIIVRQLPTVRLHVLAGASLLMVVAGGWIVWSLVRAPVSDLLTPSWFDEMLARLRFSEHRLLPSWWLSTGLLEAARHEWSESVLFLAVTLSNALAVHQLAVWTAARTYRAAYSAVEGRGTPRRRRGTALIDRLAMAVTALVSRQTRLLLIKDLRLFRRDPVQWSQFLIFFGLMALYFVNVRRLRYDVHQTTWVNMVSFLNLAVVGLILSTFTSRFIFPMISLEGRRFWVLGLLPVSRRRILWSKFLFASLGSALPCTLLVALGDVILRVLPIVLAIHLLICLLLCLGLSGMAVGLGAKMPNLREESPSKIAAGFGGTLNLVLSATYIAAVVCLTAVPCHFYVAAQQAAVRPAALWADQNIHTWLVLGTAASVVLGIVATAVPMRLGLRSFEKIEF